MSKRLAEAHANAGQRFVAAPVFGRPQAAEARQLFVIAAGNKAEPHGINVEGLRRRGFSADAISALRAAYRLLYKNSLSLEEAKVQLRDLASAGGDGDAPVQAFLDFVVASQRGIIR